MKKHAKTYDGYASDDYREYWKECREEQRKLRGYRRTDIMGDRGHIVYAILLEDKKGSKWVYVGQTKDYHTRMSEHKSGDVPSTRNSRIVKHIRLKTKLTRREAEWWENYYIGLRYSRSGYPVYGL